ncbi:hypothetical protein [Methanimicrococcus hongohii]|uniref:hypothetical protein n=1 Tax=Methanimicrococcus hongohii TaxID=3028295 RepID=UPI00293105CC|nr:hypothetical protein [Methanimicrococcus sp. Hf6]
MAPVKRFLATVFCCQLPVKPARLQLSLTKFRVAVGGRCLFAVGGRFLFPPANQVCVAAAVAGNRSNSCPPPRATAQILRKKIEK